MENDVQLIQRILSGDDSAFNALVEKHQKGVHALIWRKIGDFHYAEELTQDVFLKAYRKLGALKDPKCFAGWLYVIADRLSLNWIKRRKPPSMQSLENIPPEEIEEASYAHYITLEREGNTADHKDEIVKKLLERLPESERTVVTLHYLGEMTTKEIGNFLGVSVNTVKSRLRRGRERLQTSESLVKDVLGSVQLPADLTACIMRQVADINPTVPPTGKPLVPWVAFGAATILFVLLLGVSHQYLARFQKPYSFDARSEPTIEIVDAPIVLDLVSKPSIRNQLGRSAAPGKNVGAGTQFSEATLRTYSEENLRKFSTEQWTQTDGPPGGHVHDIYTVSDGTIFAFSATGMYKLEADATAWRPLNTGIPIDNSLMPVVENRGTLYVVSTNEIFASADKGETWKMFCSRPKGEAIGLVITEETYAQRSPADITMYLALKDKGVFQSTESGVEWIPVSNGLTGERISAIAAVGKTVFAGTNRGLYRLNSGVWRKLSVGSSRAVYSLAVLESNLYVGMGPDLYGLTPMEASAIVESGEPSSGRIYRSVDLGVSWTEITPKYHPSALPSGVRLLATGDVLLALGATQFRSTDRGDTWTNLGVDPNLFILSSSPAAVSNRTFYKAGAFGIHRTTDGGGSWHIFMDGVLGRWMNDLVTFNNRLYAYTGYEVYQSINAGVSWKKVGMAGEAVSRKFVGQDPSRIDFDYYSKFVIDSGIPYFISPEKHHLRIFRLSGDGNRLMPVQVTPIFDRVRSEENQFSEMTRTVGRRVKIKAFAISSDIFYVEYDRRLFKWRPDDSVWTDTGLIDLSKLSDDNFFDKGFELAASGETVYVGKRNGQLFQSLDEGSNWRDVTPNLPLHFTAFKEIVFVGPTVYVATDRGVLASETGEHWRVIVDKTRTPIVINQFVMNHLAVTGPSVYGVGDTGVYGLDSDGRWSQFASEVPGEVVSLGIINDKLYSATKGRGIFQISLAEE